MIFIMLCGIPGSGKTTLRTKLYYECIDSGYTARIISPDELRGVINGDQGSQENADKVWATFFRLAENAQEDFVILDATFLKKKDRKSTISRIRESIPHAEFASFAILPDLALSKERNARRERVVPDEVLESMYNRYTLPTEEEGFKTVLYVNPGDLTINDTVKV